MFEVCAGAILAQNTNWNNTRKALINLQVSASLTAKKIAGMKTSRLEKLVRPSGFFRQKALRLKEFSRLVARTGGIKAFLKNAERDDLLKVKGIGHETADSIILYAAHRPSFVVDAYTRRIFSRLGMTKEEWGYEKLKGFFESALPTDSRIYKEYHALIVELGKRVCKKRPLCGHCPLNAMCRYYRENPLPEKA
jgi:endonuclease-3 related protein